MPIEYKVIGKRIRNLRLQYNMTQEQLAEICDLSASFIGHIEKGTRIPSLETITILAEVLQTSVDHLIYGASSQFNALSSFEKTPILTDEILTTMCGLLYRHHTTVNKYRNISIQEEI